MNYLVASYYSPPYRREAMGLMESLDALGLDDYAVTAIEDRGSWERNCAFKPTFIRHKMVAHDRPIVWLDADARVRSKPVLFDTLDGFDFACHYRYGVELLSGTLWFGNTPGGWALLREWEYECAAHPDEWDQRCLAVAVPKVPGLRTYVLPAEYVRVFDDPKMGEAVIEHMQASRRLRGKITA
jgi:hypothetical protein